MANEMEMSVEVANDDIGSFAADCLRDAFNEVGISYNGAAFMRVGLLIQNWVDDGSFADGSLDTGDYYD